MSWKTFKEAKIAAYCKAKEKGEVDPDIVALVESINENPDLVSLSSCSGRINLLRFDIDERKSTAEFFAKWHGLVEKEEFEMRLYSYTEKMQLWFKVEPFILHVAAKDLESASGFLEKIRKSGVKRGGIQAISKEKVLMEVQGNDYIAVPTDSVEEWGPLLDIANRMMERNLDLLGKLEKLEW